MSPECLRGDPHTPAQPNGSCNTCCDRNSKKYIHMIGKSQESWKILTNHNLISCRDKTISWQNIMTHSIKWLSNKESDKTHSTWGKWDLLAVSIIVLHWINPIQLEQHDTVLYTLNYNENWYNLSVNLVEWLLHHEFV